MIKLIAEVGIGLLAQMAKGGMGTKAINTLVKGGLISKLAGEGLIKNPKLAKRVLAGLARKSSNLNKGLFSTGRLATASRASAFPHIFRAQAANVLKTAQGQVQIMNAYGAVSKIMFGAGAVWVGFEMTSGAESMFEKNIPGGFQEIMQTQQQFLPRQAHTKRQRAIQAIHQSQMTTRAALGNESMYMH